MNIVFLDSYTTSGLDLEMGIFHELGQFTEYDFTTPEELPSRVRDADIIIVNKCKVDEFLLSNAPHLKYIVVAATGYNNIDGQAVAKKGIPVSNVKGYSTEGVAQYVIAAMLHYHNKLYYYHQQVANGRWTDCRDFCFYDHSIQDLSMMTLGIVGYGSIGQRVGIIAQAFGMRILIYHKHELDFQLPNIKQVSLEVLLKESDIVTLHVPLNDTSKEMICDYTLSMMKEDALLINTGRGGLVNEHALMKHLELNPRFTYMADVLSQEPPIKDNPIFDSHNGLFTPHIAWASLQSRQSLVRGIFDNISAFIKGDIRNQVL